MAKTADGIGRKLEGFSEAVVLIQRSQNEDALAVHVKLNKLVAAMEGASNRVIDVEGLTSSLE